MGIMGLAQSNWRNELRAMIALAVPVVLSELGWMLQGVVTALTEVGKEHSGVANALADGYWNKNAEAALKKEFGAK